MKVYPYLAESGPKRRKTMTHVLDLPGCIAVGPTTDEAVAATPEAIRLYLRFLERHGEAVDPDEPFTIELAEHVTEGGWLGNGDPSINFPRDLEPFTPEEAQEHLRQFRWMCEELADWAETQTDEELAANPAEKGRTARAILLHTIAPVGGYLAAALGGAKGFSALAAACERGEVPLDVAQRMLADMAEARVAEATPDQYAAVIQHTSGTRTLRKKMRHLLEHHWEHLAELSRRPGGRRCSWELGELSGSGGLAEGEGGAAGSDGLLDGF